MENYAGTLIIYDINNIKKSLCSLSKLLKAILLIESSFCVASFLELLEPVADLQFV